MKIVTIGKGNVGGGLAELWRKAGHDVTEIGREGGDASGVTWRSWPCRPARSARRSAT